MPVKEYHKPVITVWDDEALSGIKARMDYGSPVNPTPPPLGSESNPIIGQPGVVVSGLASTVWIQVHAGGSVDVAISASGAVIRLQRICADAGGLDSGFRGISSNAIIERFIEHYDAYWKVEITTGTPSTTYYSVCITQCQDTTDQYMDTGAVWKPTAGGSPNRNEYTDVIYIPGDASAAFVEIVNNDLELVVGSLIHQSAEYIMQEITQIASRIDFRISACAAAVWGILNLSEPSSATEIAFEVETHSNLYANGIRAVRMHNSIMQVEYSFSPWNHETQRLEGPLGSVGEWTANDTQ